MPYLSIMLQVADYACSLFAFSESFVVDIRRYCQEIKVQSILCYIEAGDQVLESLSLMS